MTVNRSGKKGDAHLRDVFRNVSVSLESINSSLKFSAALTKMQIHTLCIHEDVRQFACLLGNPKFFIMWAENDIYMV